MNDMLALVPATPALPAILTRPDDRGAVAHLTLQVSDEGQNLTGGPRWDLKGSTAAVLLAQKLFSGARVNRRLDHVAWPAVPSMFADLLMLMHRHPTTIGKTARDLWDEQYADLIASWEADRATAPVGAPKGGGHFKGTLRDFQQSGLRFLMAHRRSLLADDMGLGKTPTALAFLDAVDDWPAVVVCQPHVLRHWQRKIEEFLTVAPADRPLAAGGAIRWHVLQGKPDRNTPKADLYLTHYLIAHNWEAWLKARGVRTVIFDEAQELRHPGTRKHDSNRAIARSARNVVGLSGTPIYNRGIEIYNVMNVLNRGSLGTKADFQRQWCPGHPEIVDQPDVLGRYMVDRGLMLRRRKEDVLAELPAKRRVIEPIDADNAKFAALLKEAVKLAKDASFIRDPFDRAKMEAEAIAQTRLATGVAKAAGVIAFLQALMEAEEPTLVFAHHHAVHDMISDALERFEPASITGRETIAQKDRAQSRFQSGETNLCLIALRAATGLDGLQHRAKVVVFAELDWSPAVHKQAEDRAHRMGQRDSILAYYLTTDLGTDPAMMATLALKESQFLGLMQDRGENEEDRAAAERAAETHKASVLEMLRGAR